MWCYTCFLAFRSFILLPLMLLCFFSLFFAVFSATAFFFAIMMMKMIYILTFVSMSLESTMTLWCFFNIMYKKNGKLQLNLHIHQWSTVAFLMLYNIIIIMWMIIEILLVFFCILIFNHHSQFQQFWSILKWVFTQKWKVHGKFTQKNSTVSAQF